MMENLEVDISVVMDKTTSVSVALWNATIEGNFNLVKELLKMNGEKNLDNAFFWLTKEHYDKEDYLEMAKLLIEKGAKYLKGLSHLVRHQKFQKLQEILEFCGKKETNFEIEIDKIKWRIYIEIPKNIKKLKNSEFLMIVEENGNIKLSEEFLVSEGFILLSRREKNILCEISEKNYQKQIEKKIYDQTDIERIIYSTVLRPM